MYMRICNKCKLEKPLDQFYTYWHSTQKKYRTRHICKQCKSADNRKWELVQKNKNHHQTNTTTPNPEPIIEIVPTPQIENKVPKNASNEELAYKTCIKCFEIKELDAFYKGRSVCSVCVLSREKQYRDEKRKIALEENGGNMRVPPKPGEYMDELQKKNVYEILTAIGWSYSEEKNRYYKPGLKSIDNKWVNPKTGLEVIQSSRHQYKYFMDNVTLETLPVFVPTKTGKNREYATAELVNAMLQDFFINKQDRKVIAKKYGVKLKMLEYYIRKIFHQIKK